MATTKSLLIQFGDGALPEVFAHNCSINTTREFTLEASTVDGTAPDCDNMDAPAWVLRSIDTLSAGISGAGTMDPVSWGVLRTKMLAGASFNMRVKLDLPLASGGGYFSGAFVINSLGAAKEGKGYVTCSVSLQSDGEITWTDAAA